MKYAADTNKYINTLALADFQEMQLSAQTDRLKQLSRTEVIGPSGKASRRSTYIPEVT